MSDSKDTKTDKHQELGPTVTRRDFVGGTLVGAGASLLAMKSPTALAQSQGKGFKLGRSMPTPLTGLGPDWTGPGGIGDYADANGNTHELVNAAHTIRNRDLKTAVRSAEDTGEEYDLVVVGAGFAGLAAAYRYRVERPNSKVIVFDAAPIFGGEARQNEFEVDGYHLWGPQGSNGNVYPINEAIDAGFGAPLWREMNLPEHFEWQEAEGLSKKITIPMDVYSPMHIAWESADQAFFYEDHGFVLNPWQNRFADAPVSDQLKQDMIWMETYRQPPQRDDWQQWLDSMTYKDFLVNEMGIKSDVHTYLNPQMAAMGTGLGSDVASAYSAYRFLQPGVVAYDRYPGPPFSDPTDRVWLASFPGGNTGQLRYIVKNLIPAAFPGGMGLTDVLFGSVQWENLDRANEPVRIRLSSMVVDVRHIGHSDSAKTVSVTYRNNGQLKRLTGKNVIVAGQQHLNKRIVSDLPPQLQEAMDTFMHAPIATVNVALRNWKFLEKLGASAVRWFGEFGWFFSLRRQMIIDGKAPMPLDPSKPTVLTMYNSFCNPGLSPEQQTVAARMQLFGMSYKEIEEKVVDQFTKMFAPYGFDAKGDIAGIVVNRQGHAYVVCPPGFQFGKDGKPAPREIVREGYGRVRFAHSELEGAQMWEGAVAEGERAVRQILELG